MDMNGSISSAIKDVESYFNAWLQMSNLTEIDFLSYRTKSNYEIRKKIENGYCVIDIGFIHNEIFKRIGEPFVFERNDISSFEDVSLLLLYIASKLDKANSIAPLFEKRTNYFFDKTKEFITSTNEYILIRKSS